MSEKAKKDSQNSASRPPIVVVLGHVDSGKTSLLDAIRQTHVAEKESGGITQHVGAYEVEVPQKEEPKSRESEANRGIPRTAQDDFANRKITFVDTPGHEAFSAMRSRGAKVADIAILVVDGISGIQPQTKEAITHIKKAGIGLIVAINKVDLRGVNPEKIKQALMKEEVTVESYGGKIPVVEVSAKTGQGVDQLLELILLLAEMEGLTADYDKPAEGVVIEAYMDNLRGPVATILLREGRLSLGEIVATSTASGKVKSLEDFKQRSIKETYPSMPVVVLGLERVPQVGDKFKVFPTVEEAQAYVQKKERKADRGQVVFVEEGKKVLNLILKADVSGSLEAIEEVLGGLPQDKVVLRILEKGVGEINENDVKLAQASKAAILGFRVKPNHIALVLKERAGIRILSFEIIYTLAQSVRQLMESQLGLETERNTLGKLKILALFLNEKNRQIVGGKVIEGEMRKGVKLEVWRNDQSLGRGRMISLQENKKDVFSVARGRECGILFEGEPPIMEGDILEAFEEVKKKGEL